MGKGFSTPKLSTRCENSERFPIPIFVTCAFAGRRREPAELGPTVRALKGKGMASKTGKTRPCNYCVVKRKGLLDCSLFSCLLGEAKAQ